MSSSQELYSLTHCSMSSPLCVSYSTSTSSRRQSGRPPVVPVLSVCPLSPLDDVPGASDRPVVEGRFVSLPSTASVVPLVASLPSVLGDAVVACAVEDAVSNVADPVLVV